LKTESGGVAGHGEQEPHGAAELGLDVSRKYPSEHRGAPSMGDAQSGGACAAISWSVEAGGGVVSGGGMQASCVGARTVPLVHSHSQLWFKPWILPADTGTALEGIAVHGAHPVKWFSRVQDCCS